MFDLWMSDDSLVIFFILLSGFSAAWVALYFLKGTPSFFCGYLDLFCEEYDLYWVLPRATLLCLYCMEIECPKIRENK